MFRSLLKQDIKSLRVFMLVADCQGITAAQSRLNMSQSSISTHLSHLEARLGFVLCKRGRSGFELTEQGKDVYQASQSLFQAAEHFNRQVQTIKGSMVGELRIAIVDQLPTNFSIAFSRTISHLYEQSPDLLVHLDIRAPQEIETAIATGDCDLGVGYFAKPIKNLNYEQILVEEQVVFCHHSHPYFSQTPSFEDLQTKAAWVKRGYLISDDLLPIKAQKSTAVAYHMEAIAHFILAGTHLGYLPVDYAQKWVDQGEFKALLPEQTRYFVTHHLVSGKQDTELKTLFVNQLKKEYAKCWNATK